MVGCCCFCKDRNNDDFENLKSVAMPPSVASMDREEADDDDYQERDDEEIDWEDMRAVDRWRRQRSGDMHYFDTRSTSNSSNKNYVMDEESDLLVRIKSFDNISNDKNDVTIMDHHNHHHHSDNELPNHHENNHSPSIEVMRNLSQKETFSEEQLQNNEMDQEVPIDASDVVYTMEKPQNTSRDSDSLNDAYLSSSSSTEDHIIFSHGSGPIDLDDVDDGALTRIHRPSTDDGESQPSQTNSWKKSNLTRSISAESQELDAMVAAIDAVRHHQPSPGSSVKQPPRRSPNHHEHITSVRKQLTMPPKRLLSPNRRDSPPVRFEELDGSFPPLVTPEIPRGRGTSVSTPSERRRQRSLSRGRTSRSASPAFERKQQHVPSTPSTATATTPPGAPQNNRNHSTPSWDDSEDRLSDVPSDVETDVRERYFTACRLLKSTLIEKASKLKPSEKDFLFSLLERNGNNEEPSEEHVSTMESLAETLQIGDSLFQEDNQSLEREAEMMNEMKVWASYEDNVKNEEKQNTSLNKVSPKAQPSEPSPTSTLSPVSSSIYIYDYPFKILGTDDGFRPSVLTPAVMEALRGFFPPDISQENFLLKFSTQRDGADLTTLLAKIRYCKYTILCVETSSGHVFGAFCSSPWRVQLDWYGEKNAFLWRLKRSREKGYFDISSFDLDNDNEMEVFPCTGHDHMIQYCTNKTIAVGGSTYWAGEGGNPYSNEPEGIGLLIDGDLLGGETNSCATFANPRLGDRSSSSLNEFDIETLEVWTVTPSTTTAEAEKHEIRRLYLERNAKNQQ